MQKTHRLVVDAMAEIYPILKHWVDHVFYEFSEVATQPDTVYVIGRQHLINDLARIRNLCEQSKSIIVFNNSAEGSWTINSQLLQLRLDDLVRRGLLLVVAGAEISEEYTCLTHEHLLTTIMDYDDNLQAQKQTDSIFSTTNKPYKFVFLNGRARPHRKYLYEKFKRLGLLDQALWTMLEAKPCVWRSFSLLEGDVNVMATPTPLTRLPDYYEVPRYRNAVFGPIVPDRSFLKQELFRQEWGEIYLHAPVYINSYFSVVTETVCAESTISFRTEKIAKPLAIGHPFVVVANPGYYRDLKNLGFKTFSHLIDESFDNVDHAQDRVDRITQVVQDLCQQDLDSFMAACRDVCKYNQQHLVEFTNLHRQEFPARFFQFIQDHARS